jgi:hypothetical protein
MNWSRILAYVTGTVDQELLLRNEYLAAENRILKAQSKGRLRLSDAERGTLGEIAHRLGRKVLGEVANVARPDTILAWYRKLVARKFDGSKARRGPGRPRVDRALEQLIVRMAEENRDWGYDRIVGALANLGYEISDQSVGNILRRHAVPPAPERRHTTTWPAFIRTHLALLAGTDFFTAEVLTLRGLLTYYVLFFIHLESRRVDIAGITVHPDERWMQQIARNVTMEGCGALRNCRYLLHDRDTKYTQSFRAIIASGQVEPLALPARSPNLNAYAERWVRSVKEECLSKVILFGERSLRQALSEYVEHFHAERNHQGKGNVLLFPRDTDIRRAQPVQCRERLGGLLRYYHQQDSNDSLLGGLRPMLRGELECMFEHLMETGVDAVSQPFVDGFLPGIDDEACLLLGGRECFEFRRFEPPGRARLELMHRLGPKLVAHLFQAIAVNHAAASDWPEPPRTGRVFQIAAYGRIDGGREHALPWQVDCVLAVRRAKTIMTASQERLYGGRCSLRQRIHFRNLDEQYACHLEGRILAAEMTEPIGEPVIMNGKRSQRLGLLLTLRTLQDEYVVYLAARLIDASDR